MLQCIHRLKMDSAAEYLQFEDTYLGQGNASYDTNMRVSFSLKANKSKCTKENCLEMLQSLCKDMEREVSAVFEQKTDQA